MKIEIRDAVDEDLEVLLSIQKSAFTEYTDHLRPEQIPPLNETFDDMKKDFQYKSIMASFANNSPAGSIRYHLKGGVCIIERLSVKPGFQRNGIGRSMVSHVETIVTGKAHKIYLETGLLEKNLLLFYSSMGFSAEAVLRRHYGGFDWIAFSKFI
ncbi:MAG TPA: GNAT family N-acetyltransferase [Dissulfurispiraceae bacterium]|nr:GNAT family N-acetyltransferase [Dissulfurispiraceae bacterium]